MKEIWSALKSNSVAVSTGFFVLIVIYVTASIALVVTTTNVFISTAPAAGIALAGFLIGTFIAILASLSLFLVCLTRLRSFYIFLFNLILGALILYLAASLLAGFLASPLLGTIFVFAYFQYFLVYGLAVFFYFRLRSVFLAISSISIYFFSLMVTSLSDRLVVTNAVNDQTIANNFAILWTGPEIFLMLIYLALIAGFIVVDNRLNLSQWQGNLGSKVRIGWKNYALFGSIIVLALLFVSIVGPLFWRAEWEQVNTEMSVNEESQRPSEEEQLGQNPQLPEQQPGDGEESPENQQPQSPGGQLPRNVPQPNQDSILAVVRYGSASGFDGQFTPDSDPETPDFISTVSGESAVSGITQVESDAEAAEENEYQYFRSEVYDMYEPEVGFQRDYEIDETAVDGDDVRGFFYDEDFEGREFSGEVYQTVLWLNGKTLQVIGLTDQTEVGFLGLRKAPYFYGYENGVVVANVESQIRPNDSYYVLSSVAAVDEESALSGLDYPDYFNSSVDRTNFTNLFDREFRELGYEILGIESGSELIDVGYYEMLDEVRGYLRENYRLKESESTTQPSNSDQLGEIQQTQTLEGESGGNLEEEVIAPDFESLTADDISGFLFGEDKEGTETEFAGAFTAIVQSLNSRSITRVTAGFRTSQYSPEAGGYIVSTNDLHYWNEVYFEDYGWITFDITEGLAPDEPDLELSEEQQNEYDEKLDEDERNLEDRQQRRREFRQEQGGDFQPETEDDIREFNQPQQEEQDNEFDPQNPPQELNQPEPLTPQNPPNLSGLIRVVLIGFIVCLVIFIFGYLVGSPIFKYLKYKHLLSKASNAESKRQSIILYYEALQLVMSYYDLNQKKVETLSDYQSRVSDPRINNILEAYEKAIYSKSGYDTYNLAQLESEINDFVSDLVRSEPGKTLRVMYLKLP